MGIDRRRNYYIIIDTETCGSIGRPYAYDVGIAVIDKNGTVYESYSLVVDEVFNGLPHLMESVYYADKIPQYVDDIENGSREVTNFFTVRKLIFSLCDKYNTYKFVAHNIPFDERSLRTTQDYTTEGRYKYFFPKDAIYIDTQRMARDTICKQKSYIRFCEKHNLYTPSGRLPEKAETIYQYMLDDVDYEESHTGLEDVMIEKEIFARCLRQHKKMNPYYTPKHKR